MTIGNVKGGPKIHELPSSPTVDEAMAVQGDWGDRQVAMCTCSSRKGEEMGGHTESTGKGMETAADQAGDRFSARLGEKQGSGQWLLGRPCPPPPAAFGSKTLRHPPLHSPSVDSRSHGSRPFILPGYNLKMAYTPSQAKKNPFLGSLLELAEIRHAPSLSLSLQSKVAKLVGHKPGISLPLPQGSLPETKSKTNTKNTKPRHSPGGSQVTPSTHIWQGPRPLDFSVIKSILIFLVLFCFFF